MNGIAGLLRSDGLRTPPQTLEQDLERMVRRRAGDGIGASGGGDFWSEGGVGLAGRRGALCHPPHDDRGAPVVVAADARLDNRDALARTLGLSPAEAAVRSDADLIRGAYERWGERCPHHLDGPFAFAVWDRRSRTLFCARDRFGLRPFYTASARHEQSGALFAFASRIGPLLALAEVPRRPDETAVADFLMGMAEDRENTFYEGVRRLPPAHALTVTPEGSRLRPYWTLDEAAEEGTTLGPRRNGSLSPVEADDAYAEAYRALFLDAVRPHLRRCVRLGTTLSGGLDSSAVACAARALLGKDASDERRPLDAFSLVFPSVPSSDERPYIEAVLAQGGFTPHLLPGDRHGPLDELDRVLDACEEPPWTPNLFLHRQLWAACREAGVDALLDGFLGDQVVLHGDRYLTELAARGRWLSLAREVRVTAQLQPRPRRAARRLLRQYVTGPLIAEPLRRKWHALTQRATGAPPVLAATPLVRADFLLGLGWPERARQYHAVLRTPRTVHEEHRQELSAGLLPRTFETAHKAAGGVGVEARFPFADRRLVGFCLALPPTQRYRAGWTRAIARQALRGLVPEAVRGRYGKANLAPNFEQGLRERSADAVSGLLVEGIDVASSYVEAAAVREAAQRFLSGGGGLDAALLWRLAVLTRWLEREQAGGDED